MRTERAREFLFEPSRFKNDPAVMRMTLAARGAYAILFCEAWDMPEPGVLPDDDGLLATLSRTDFESWMGLRNEVKNAFDLENRPGFWVQNGLVATYESQKSWYANQIEAGRKGGLKGRYKARLRLAVPQGEGREVEVLTTKEKEKDSSSVPLTEPISPKSQNGQVNPGRARPVKAHTDPGPAFWNDPDTQDKIGRLVACGSSEAEARILILTTTNAEARLGGRR